MVRPSLGFVPLPPPLQVALLDVRACFTTAAASQRCAAMPSYSAEIKTKWAKNSPLGAAATPIPAESGSREEGSAPPPSGHINQNYGGHRCEEARGLVGQARADRRGSWRSVSNGQVKCQVKLVLPTKIQNSPPVVPGKGRSCRRQN